MDSYYYKFRHSWIQALKYCVWDTLSFYILALLESMLALFSERQLPCDEKKVNNPSLNSLHSPQSQERDLMTFNFSKETISNESVERMPLVHFFTERMVVIAV